jgi:hypothetical protein
MDFIADVVRAVIGFFIGLGMFLGLGVTPPQKATLEVGDSAVSPQSVEAEAEAITTGENTPSSTQVHTDTALTGTAINLAALPLGDGRYTTSGPKKGYIYLCRVGPAGGGAQANGSWIHGTTWDALQKLAVQGSVTWPNATVNISVQGNTRTITSNDLPTNHTTGIFPVAPSDPAYAIDRNPSSITAQNVLASLPATPTLAATAGCIFGEVGIMTNGVYLYDGFDAGYRDAVAHEVQDSCGGHPNNHGYHYHSLSPCFKNTSIETVLGWAYDGFPITGNRLPNDSQLSTADLDECHGMTGTVRVDGKAVTTYHYVMTQDFPYSVGCFKGKSYAPRPGGGMQGPGPML